MKVKFINKDFNCSGHILLELGELYESDLCMDSEHCYYIKGNYFPKTWFQIIEQ